MIQVVFAEYVVDVLAAVEPMRVELVLTAWPWRRPIFVVSPSVCKHSAHRTSQVSYEVYLHICRWF